MDVVAEFKAQNPSLFSRGSAIPVTYNKTKSNALTVAPRVRAMSANSAKRGVSLPLPAGFINGSHNLLASLNFQPSAPAATNGTRFSPSEEVNDGQDKTGKAGQGFGVQGNSSENTTFSYPRSGPNRPLPQLKNTDNNFTSMLKPNDSSGGQDSSKNGSAFTAPSSGQHQPVVLLKRPQSAIVSTVNIHDRTLSAINRINREREPVRQSSPLTVANINKQTTDSTSTDAKDKDKDSNTELDNFLMLPEKDNKSSLLVHSSSSVSTQLNSASTLPIPSIQASVRVPKRVRFSEQLVAFEPNQTQRGRLLAEAPSRIARSTSSCEVKPILKFTTQMSSIAGTGSKNGQLQQQLHLQQQMQQQQQAAAAAQQQQQQQNHLISLKNPAAMNANNNANINSNYLNSSPISTTINTINTMNNTLSNKNLANNDQQQQRPSTTQSMIPNRSQSMKISSPMPAFNPRDSLTHKSVEMIRRGMAGIAYNTMNGDFNAEEQAAAMGMEEIKFDVNGSSSNGVSRSSPITWDNENTNNNTNNNNSSSLKTGATTAADEKKKASTTSTFPRFDMGKRRPKSAPFSAADNSGNNTGSNGLASLLTVSSNGNSSSYNSYSSGSESVVHQLPAKAFSIGTTSCRAASPVQFYSSYMQFSFQPPFESSGRSIMISYIDIQGMTLIGTKFRFKAPQRVLEDGNNGNSGNGSMNGEKNYVLLEFMSTMQIATLREKIIPMILEGQQQSQQSQQTR